MKIIIKQQYSTNALCKKQQIFSPRIYPWTLFLCTNNLSRKDDMMKQSTHLPIESFEETLLVKCTKDKYGNFKYGKTYVAESTMTHIGKSKHYGKTVYTGFKVTDEDGDYYSLTAKDLVTIFVLERGSIL